MKNNLKGKKKNQNSSKNLTNVSLKDQNTVGKGLNNQQFDNILPPEVPTSWVQCEKCHQWYKYIHYI